MGWYRCLEDTLSISQPGSQPECSISYQGSRASLATPSPGSGITASIFPSQVSASPSSLCPCVSPTVSPTVRPQLPAQSRCAAGPADSVLSRPNRVYMGCAQKCSARPHGPAWLSPTGLAEAGPGWGCAGRRADPRAVVGGEAGGSLSLMGTRSSSPGWGSTQGGGDTWGARCQRGDSVT